MCKGAGMIMPNMATMIAVITTDVPIAAPDLSQALTAAVNKSFNKVTVDSDTSTNDTCFALASGAAAPDGPAFTPGTPAFDADVYKRQTAPSPAAGATSWKKRSVPESSFPSRRTIAAPSS